MPSRRIGPDEASYAAAIAGALQIALPDAHRIKLVMRWTGASGRTVKNWFVGANGPSGPHLGRLVQCSDVVLCTFLAFAGRHDVLTELLPLLNAKKPISGPEVSLPTSFPADPASALRRFGVDVRSGDSRGDQLPNGLINGPTSLRLVVGLNRRQRWFMREVGKGRSVGAADLARRWGVSVRTAKRDIAKLKIEGIVTFVGARRNGRYSFC